MPVYPTVVLEADGLEPFTLDPAAGLFGQRLDLGAPVPRVDSEEAPDADGTDDSTEFFGASNVTLAVIIYPETESPWALEQRLRAFAHPRRRPIMTIQRAADAPLERLTLRGSSISAVIGEELRPASQSDPEGQLIALQWVNPFGIVESAELHEAIAYAAGDGTIDGLVAPVVAPWVLTAAAPAGSVTVVNAGNADAPPTVLMYGPCEGPVLRNELLERSIVFADTLEILAGEFVEVDFRARTMLYNGDPSSSVEDQLDRSLTRWWWLRDGEQRIRYQPTDFSSPAQAVIRWRDARI